MAQISVRMKDGDLALLKEIAGTEGLRPLTFASMLLTTAVRGQRAAAHEWFLFKAAANTGAIKVGEYPVPWKPDEVEKEFGEGKDFGTEGVTQKSRRRKSFDVRLNPETGKWEE